MLPPRSRCGARLRIAADKEKRTREDVMKAISRRTTLAGGVSAAALAIGAPRVARAAEFTMKWGHSMATSHPINTRGEEAMENVRRESNGRLDVRVFPDNQLGGDNDMTSQ